MVVFTDCKINIGLNILRRRPDGYHDIDTCMMPLPWHDIVEILPTKGNESTLTVLGNKVDCPVERNLVMKAYRALAAECDLPPVDIVLQKVVPDGAGLGGGSSDASHTLRALNDMFGLGLSLERLAKVAGSLGADCPIFVYDRPMMARGIGEVLTPIDITDRLRGYTIVLAKPLGVAVSTKEAYAGVKPALPSVDLETLLQQPVEQWMGCVKNDFEASVIPLAPAIGQLKDYMIEQGAVYAAMSGSGASVYGIFASDKMAERAKYGVLSLPHFAYKVQ